MTPRRALCVCSEQSASAAKFEISLLRYYPHLCLCHVSSGRTPPNQKMSTRTRCCAYERGACHRVVRSVPGMWDNLRKLIISVFPHGLSALPRPRGSGIKPRFSYPASSPHGPRPSSKEILPPLMAMYCGRDPVVNVHTRPRGRGRAVDGPRAETAPGRQPARSAFRGQPVVRAKLPQERPANREAAEAGRRFRG